MSLLVSCVNIYEFQFMKGRGTIWAKEIDMLKSSWYICILFNEYSGYKIISKGKDFHYVYLNWWEIFLNKKTDVLHNRYNTRSLCSC